MIKKTGFSLAVFVSAFYLLTSMSSYSKVAEPPLLNSGAPVHGSCTASSCHGGSPNTGSGSVEIDFNNGGSLLYEVGQTYDITVSVMDNNQSRFGFEMVAFNKDELDGGATFDLSEGVFIASGTNTGTQTDALGDRYVNHAQIPLNNSSNFNFQWTAPNENVGDITFYVSGCAANGNNNRTGDLIYTNNLTVSFDSGNSIDDLESSMLNVYPNPATDYLSIDLANTDILDGEVALYDVQGRLIDILVSQENWQMDVLNYIELPAQLEAGVYILKLEAPQTSYSTQLVVQ